LTPEKLIEEIRNFSQRFYGYDTPVDCQDKSITALRTAFGGRVRIIENRDDLVRLEVRNSDIVIIQNADEIINGLQDLTPLEKLNKSDSVFLLFFNGKITGEKRLEDWPDFLQNARNLQRVTIDCNGPNNGNGDGRCFLISLVEWLKRIFIKIKSVFNNPRTRRILLYLFNGIGAAILVWFLSVTFKCS
jgi:hypothetical protein